MTPARAHRANPPPGFAGVPAFPGGRRVPGPQYDEFVLDAGHAHANDLIDWLVTCLCSAPGDFPAGLTAAITAVSPVPAQAWADRAYLAALCHGLADQAQRLRAAVAHLDDDWIDRSELTPDWIARHLDRTGELSDPQVLAMAARLEETAVLVARRAQVRVPHQLVETVAGQRDRKEDEVERPEAG